MNDVLKGMPKHVRIGCFNFEVVLGTELEHDISRSYGFMASTLKRISLRPDMSAQETANTFIHEVIHAIHYVFGLIRNEEEMQPSEEEYTTLLANGLCAFWQDNPVATKWWTRLVMDGAR